MSPLPIWTIAATRTSLPRSAGQRRAIVTHSVLFENPGNGNDWISLKLVGVKTNRSAIGARIKVTVENRAREHVPFIVRSEAEDLSERLRCSNTSVWARTHESSSWKSGGRPATPGSIFPMWVRTNFWKSRSFLRSTPSWTGRQFGWEAQSERPRRLLGSPILVPHKAGEIRRLAIKKRSL